MGYREVVGFILTLKGQVFSLLFITEDGEILLLIGVATLSVFLVIETRRYRGYEIWRTRVRKIQENVRSYGLDPSAGLVDPAWREKLSEDYRSPAIKISAEEAPKMSSDEFVKVIDALTNVHETELDLASITAPTLVLYGEHDAGFIRRHAPRLADEIPVATLREVPDGGHASNLDNPEFFATAIRESLTRHRRGGGPTPTENTNRASEILSVARYGSQRRWIRDLISG